MSYCTASTSWQLSDPLISGSGQTNILSKISACACPDMPFDFCWVTVLQSLLCQSRPQLQLALFCSTSVTAAKCMLVWRTLPNVSSREVVLTHYSMIPRIQANQRHDCIGMYSTKDWRGSNRITGFYTRVDRKGKWRDIIVDALLPHKLLFNSSNVVKNKRD